MRISRKQGAVLAALGLLLGITGCGRDTVNYNLDTSAGTDEEANLGQETVISQIDTAETWETEFDVTSAQGVSKVHISASLLVPETDSLSVVDVEEVELNADYKRTMAGEIFGNEPVCIYGMEWPTRQELTEMLEKIPVWMESNQQELSQMTEEETEENADMARYQSELQASMDFYREELKAYESMLDSAPEEPMETTDFSQWNYISKRNGMSYILRFSDSETEITDGYYHPEDVACVTRKKSISLEPEDYHDLCPEELQAAEQVSCWEVSEENAGENLCSLSRAEVIDLASRFVNSLGFSDLEPGDVCPLNWGGESDSGSSEIEVTDGYVVSMVHKADGIELGGSSMDYSVYGDETKSWSQYELQNTMKLYVTDDGVIAMFCMNPFTKTAVTAKVPLLPLDSIENIMIQELTENFDRYVPEAATGTQGFTSMELVYFRVQDQEENSRKYSYVPAWRLSKSPSDSGELGSCIVINAIDGSVIDVEKEVFDAK